MEGFDSLEVGEIVQRLNKLSLVEIIGVIDYLESDQSKIQNVEKAKQIFMQFIPADFSFSDCCKYISSFRNIPICAKFGELYSDDQKLVESDWQYEIEQKDKKIEDLEKEIETLKDQVFQEFTSEQLFKAIDAGDEKLVAKIVLMNKDLLEEKNNNGETPLSYASYKGTENILKILIKNGANIESGDDESDTPLMMASLYGKLENVKVLVDSGATVNKVDNEGDTPLHLAALHKHVDVVDFLLQHGANKHLRNVRGKTAYEVSNQEIPSLQ